ncbi:LysE family translocator [Nocardia macrotermitis]|uniref:Leucine efflux protein n=1 Tax=Nocardia macrotermitis TaxID=2585198 RepID=A0A7K0CX42_9NOCA|nr:LysE family translocator [Nocardia macrotermitis]MQY17983.1 Leucine efflux protein [Nocardia macrotermitis]
MSVSLLLGFLGLCVLLALTPGPDTLLVLRYAIAGRRPAVAAAVGCALGGIAWAVVVAAGVAALLEQSATAYRVLKVVGGIYLVYLGIRTLRDHRRARADAEAQRRPESGETLSGGALSGRAASTRSAAVAGVLSCLSNPKVGLFYLAVLPQFLTRVTFGATLTLGVIESCVAATEMVLLAVAAASAVRLVTRPRVRDRLEQISAGVLGALGIGTIASAA